MSREAEKLLKEMKPLDKPLHLKFCIFDLLGRTGPVYNVAKDLAIQAQRWNVFVQLQVFTNEGVAADSFKAGECDGVAMSTLRARQFNSFFGSLDAVGAVPTYAHMKTALTLLMGSPKFNALTINGAYQVAGIAPLGAAYVMVNDRSINSIEKAAGKKIAVLDWDKSQAKMVQQLGAQPVSSDITNFSNKFNNGQVDIIAAPAAAFFPLELYRGMGDRGGIFKLPLVNITGTAIINRDKLIKDVPDLDYRMVKLRQFGLTYMDMAFSAIAQIERQINSRYWIEIADADQLKYQVMMREARIQLTKDGVYDKRMMAILKKIRCHHDPGLAECSLTDE